MVKQRIKMLKKGEYVRFKNCERKIKSPFMIYADFESILVPGDNGKQNPEESDTNKYQKQVSCSYGYKLVCVDDNFSKTFKSYLGKDAVYNFVNSMVEECNSHSRDENGNISPSETAVLLKFDTLRCLENYITAIYYSNYRLTSYNESQFLKLYCSLATKEVLKEPFI